MEFEKKEIGVNTPMLKESYIGEEVDEKDAWTWDPQFPHKRGEG